MQNVSEFSTLSYKNAEYRLRFQTQIDLKTGLDEKMGSIHYYDASICKLLFLSVYVPQS